MELQIRLAAPDDLAAIVEIYNSVIPGNVTADTEKQSVESKKDWFKAHNAFYPLFVAESEGRIAGYAELHPFYERPAYSITAETGIYLHPDFRGKGIAKMLIQKCVDHAVNNGIENLVAFIFKENSDSISFFTNLGFENCGELKDVAKMNSCYYTLVILKKHL